MMRLPDRAIVYTAFTPVVDARRVGGAQVVPGTCCVPLQPATSPLGWHPARLQLTAGRRTAPLGWTVYQAWHLPQAASALMVPLIIGASTSLTGSVVPMPEPEAAFAPALRVWRRCEDWELSADTAPDAGTLPPAWLPIGTLGVGLVATSLHCEAGDVVATSEAVWQLVQPADGLSHASLCDSLTPALGDAQTAEQVLSGWQAWRMVRPDPARPAGPAGRSGLRWGQAQTRSR